MVVLTPVCADCLQTLGSCFINCHKVNNVSGMLHMCVCISEHILIRHCFANPDFKTKQNAKAYCVLKISFIAQIN